MAESGRIFHCFLRLPTELRLNIWNLTLQQSRIVPIICGARSISALPDTDGPRLSSPGCVSSARIPATLHTCRESRNEALRKYQLTFSMYGHPGRIYFNPDTDFIYFGHRDGYMASESQFRTVMSLCRPEDLALVKKVAINDALFWVGCQYQFTSGPSKTVETLNHLRTRMPALQEIVFVPRDENPVYDNEAVFLDPDPSRNSHHRFLEEQVDEAMGIICQQDPEWGEAPPAWSVMMLGTPESRVSDEWGLPLDHELVERRFLYMKKQKQKRQREQKQQVASYCHVREGYYAPCSGTSSPAFHVPYYVANPSCFYS